MNRHTSMALILCVALVACSEQETALPEETSTPAGQTAASELDLPQECVEYLDRARACAANLAEDPEAVEAQYQRFVGQARAGWEAMPLEAMAAVCTSANEQFSRQAAARGCE